MDYRNSMTRRTTFLIGLLVVACGGGDDGGPNPTPGPDVSGQWTIVEAFANLAQGISCSAIGVLDLASTEQGFNGTVTQTGFCDTPSGQVDNSGTGPVNNGRTTDTTITFRQPGCRYQGRLYHSPPDSADGTVSCTASLPGGDITLAGAWYIVRGADQVPPTVTASQIIQTDLIIVPGDTFYVEIQAVDDRALAWVGAALGPPINRRDSVPASGTADRDSLLLVAQAGWVGTSSLTLFARDEVGRLVETTGSNVSVLDMVRRPIQILDLPVAGTVGTYDAKRDRLYIPEPSLAQLAVVDLASFTAGSPISLAPVIPPRAHCCIWSDITPGMDSLVLSTAEPADSTVVFLNLVSGALTPVGVPDSGRPIRAFHPLLTQDDRLVIFGELSLQPGLIQFGLWSYDLAAGTTRRQKPATGAVTALARTENGAELAMLTYPPNCGYRYDSGTDTIGVCQPLTFLNGTWLSVDAAGARWLHGNLVLDGSFNVVATLNAAATLGGGVLLPDASAAWYIEALGVVKLRLSDGAVLVRVRVPGVPGDQLRLLPDARRLLIFSQTSPRLTMVDVP